MRYVECAADGVGQCVYCAAACVAECDAGIVGSQTEVLLECVSLENKFKTYTLYFTLSDKPHFFLKIIQFTLQTRRFTVLFC